MRGEICITCADQVLNSDHIPHPPWSVNIYMKCKTETRGGGGHREMAGNPASSESQSDCAWFTSSLSWQWLMERTCPLCPWVWACRLAPQHGRARTLLLAALLTPQKWGWNFLSNEQGQETAASACKVWVLVARLAWLPVSHPRAPRPPIGVGGSGDRAFLLAISPPCEAPLWAEFGTCIWVQCLLRPFQGPLYKDPGVTTALIVPFLQWREEQAGSN